VARCLEVRDEGEGVEGGKGQKLTGNGVVVLFLRDKGTGVFLQITCNARG
jgi:hypothetical protein